MGKVMSPRKLKNTRLLVAIKTAHQRGRSTYGAKKIQDELGGSRHLCRLEPNRAAAQVVRHPLHARRSSKITTDSKHNPPVTANSLNRQFAQANFKTLVLPGEGDTKMLGCLTAMKGLVNVKNLGICIWFAMGL